MPDEGQRTDGLVKRLLDRANHLEPVGPEEDVELLREAVVELARERVARDRADGALLVERQLRADELARGEERVERIIDLIRHPTADMTLAIDEEGIDRGHATIVHDVLLVAIASLDAGERDASPPEPERIEVWYCAEHGAVEAYLPAHVEAREARHAGRPICTAGMHPMGGPTMLTPPDRQGEGEPERCGAFRDFKPEGAPLAGYRCVCQLPKGHDGPHRDPDLPKEWSDDALRERDEARADAAQLREALGLQAEAADKYRAAMDAARAEVASLLDALRNPSDELVALMRGHSLTTDTAKNRLRQLHDWLVEHGHAQGLPVAPSAEFTGLVRQRLLHKLNCWLDDGARCGQDKAWVAGLADKLVGSVESTFRTLGHAQESDGSTAADGDGGQLAAASQLREDVRAALSRGDTAFSVPLSLACRIAGYLEAQESDGRQDAIDEVVSAWRNSAYVGGPSERDCARLTMDRLAPFASPDPQSDENPERAAEREERR